MLVIKLGGSAGINLDPFCEDIARLSRTGEKLIIVHGGSDATTRLSEQLGRPPVFITSPSGHTSRRTDRRTLEIFQMACRGVLNQQVVERLQRLGINAVGISGMDGRLWVGQRKAAIRAVENGVTRIIRDDFSGTVDTVNPQIIHTLLSGGFIPVISPPAVSTDGEPMNVDADRAAASTASAVGASALLLLSNVPGLLRQFPDESSLIREIKRTDFQRAEGFAQGRMKKKVLAASEAVLAGVQRAIIGDARAAEPITSALAGQGTVFA
ncbi:MAG: [LysW]-aminoadipate kinase [Phycisphaerales bacterium]|nr:[LysW]-aminoadipate kinase [Phycisphaerales bacterium]